MPYKLFKLSAVFLISAGLGSACQSSVDCAEYPRTKCTNPGQGGKFCQCNDNAGYIQVGDECICDLVTSSNPPCINDKR